MFKITVIGLAGYLLPAVKEVAKIEYVDEYSRTFTASFDGWHVKIKYNRVRIKNPENQSIIILANNEFERITIE